MTSEMTAILERLATARKVAGLTQTQAAKLLGLQTAQGLCDIEKGRNPLTMERFLTMCEIYLIDQVWALTGVNQDFDPAPVVEGARKAGMAAAELADLLELLAMGKQDKP